MSGLRKVEREIAAIAGTRRTAWILDKDWMRGRGDGNRRIDDDRAATAVALELEVRFHIGAAEAKRGAVRPVAYRENIGHGIEALGERGGIIVDSLEIDLVRTRQRAISGEPGNQTGETRRSVEFQDAGRAVELHAFRRCNRVGDLQRRAGGDRECAGVGCRSAIIDQRNRVRCGRCRRGCRGQRQGVGHDIGEAGKAFIVTGERHAGDGRRSGQRVGHGRIRSGEHIADVGIPDRGHHVAGGVVGGRRPGRIG